jgi:hypothetical protein
MSSTWTDDELRRIGTVTGPHAAPVTLGIVPKATA